MNNVSKNQRGKFVEIAPNINKLLIGAMLILNLERTLFIRHQNGCLTKIAIKFDCFLTIGILPSLYFVVSDSKNLCNR